MTDICTGLSCGIPAGDTFLCSGCYSDLTQILAELPFWINELQTTIGRQVRFSSGRIGGRSAETPLTINLAASDIRSDLRSTLVGIIRHLIEHRGATAKMPQDDLESMAKWVFGYAMSIRLDPIAGELLDELHDITRRIKRVCDRPADGWYAGICSVQTPAGECPRRLYAHRPKGPITCPLCGTTHEVENRRQIMLDAARETQATLREIKEALPVLYGTHINDNTLKSWRFRRRLLPHGTDRDGQPLFRIGDVLDLAEETARGRAS